jgi:hypothetical protein
MHKLRVSKCKLVGRRTVGCSGGEVVGTHTESCAKSTEKLQRWNPRPGLNSGYVRGRAVGEREIALPQAAFLAQATNALADLDGVIDV